MLVNKILLELTEQATLQCLQTQAMLLVLQKQQQQVEHCM